MNNLSGKRKILDFCKSFPHRISISNRKRANFWVFRGKFGQLSSYLFLAMFRFEIIIQIFLKFTVDKKSFRLKYSRFRKIIWIVHHSQKRCYNAISFLDDVPIDFSILNAYMRNRVGYWSKSKIFMQNSIEVWTFFDDKLPSF